MTEERAPYEPHTYSTAVWRFTGDQNDDEFVAVVRPRHWCPCCDGKPRAFHNPRGDCATCGWREDCMDAKTEER